MDRDGETVLHTELGSDIMGGNLANRLTQHAARAPAVMKWEAMMVAWVWQGVCNLMIVYEH